MVKRDELLEILTRYSLKELVQFILQCKREDSGCLSDILSACSKKQLTHIWKTTHAIVGETLHDIIPEENVEDSDKLDLLQSLILMMVAMLSQPDVNICEPMFETAYLLKDSFQAIPPSKETLKNSLAKLFEDWWHKNLYGSHHLINSTFHYVLDRSIDLKHKEVAAVVKRVWSLHEVIPLIDLHAEGNLEVRQMLYRCFISPQYVKSNQGIMFLAFLLSEDSAFTASLHKTIKNHLPNAPRAWAERYGEVYFRAWQILYKSGGDKLLEFEQNCIQDLMSLAIQTPSSLATAFRKLLGYIQKKKIQHGVEEMLCRLYDPIIWRMLKVAHYQVRENAAKLFFDVFPISNPDHNKSESQQLLNKQFELFTFLLNDPSPAVRSVTVWGIFQVMTDYWELFSDERLKNLMKTFVVDLRLDSTSKVVRENVISGFICLLNNPLSHTFLKTVLPKLQGSFHDTAEVVRVAMVDLLIKVRKVRRIKFWDIVSIEHLLARLAYDEDPVNRRIVELLFEDFVPLNDSVDVQIERSVYLIESNRLAMREFFLHAAKRMSLSDTVDYILTLCKAVLIAVKKAEKESHQENTQAENDMESEKGSAQNNDNDDDSDDADDEDDADDVNKGDQDYYDKLSVDNTTLMLGLLEGMFILWTRIHAQLSQSSNADLKKHLDKRLGLGAIQMVNVFKDPEIVSVLVRMLGFLPANYIPTINRSWLPKLRSMNNENNVEDFEDLVVSLCQINRASDVFELAIDWIKSSLEKKKPEQNSAKRSKKQRRVRICDPLKPQPLLGIKLLGFMFKDRVTNRIILEKNMDEILTVRDILQNSMSEVEAVFDADASDPDENDGLFAMLSVTLYWKILFQLHSEDETSYNCLSEMCDILAWAVKHVTPVLGGTRERGGSVSNKDTIEERKKSLAVNIIENLLELVCTLFLCGNGDRSFCTAAVEICTEVLANDPDLQFLPNVLQCLYHNIQFVKFKDEADITSGLENCFPGVLRQLFVSLSSFIKKHEESSNKVLQANKADMLNMMNALYTKHTFTESSLDTAMATMLAIVMAEMGYNSQQLELEETPDLSTLPSLSKWLLEIIQRKPVILKMFIKNFEDHCRESQSVTSLHSIHGAVHLIGALQKCKFAEKGLKATWGYLTKSVDQFTNTLNTEETESHKDILTSITNKVNQCKETFSPAEP